MGHSFLTVAVHCLLKWQRSASSVDIVGEKEGLDCRDPPVGTEYSNPPSPGQPCNSLAWKKCQSAATHPASPPLASACSQGQQNTQLSGIYETSGHVHRTENLTCCYGNLGFFAQQRIKPVSIPRAAGAVFDLEIALPNL